MYPGILWGHTRCRGTEGKLCTQAFCGGIRDVGEQKGSCTQAFCGGIRDVREHTGGYVSRNSVGAYAL
jgi:hypothetical protein